MKSGSKAREVVLSVVVLSAVLAAGCGKDEKRGPTASATRTGPVLPVAGTPQPPVLQTRSETRQFRTWSATCGNDGACWAFGFAPDLQAGWIRVAMPPGPDARPDVRFGFWPDSDTDAASSMALTIDGVAFPAVLVPDAPEDAPVGVIQGDARRVLAAAAQGRSMTIDGGATQAVSLDGAAAALLWIDERQGRAGTPTALIRRGDRPASTIPAPPPLPVVRVAPPVDQAGFGKDGQRLPSALQTLAEVRICIDDFSTPAVGDMVMLARLDARTELWAAPCGAGAYNVTHRWYLTEAGGRNPRALQLAGSLPAGGKSGDLNNITVNGEYNPRMRTLSAFAQGRGVGDCGTMQTWAWTGEGFLLTAERVMTQRAGVPVDLWPVSWRTQ